MLSAASQERIRAVKDSLQSCKNLLHCKRDELRRLWIEGVEMKTVYASLDAVEQVKDVSEQIPALIAGRKYQMATELVISSLAILDTELSDVEALQQVRFMCSLVYVHSASYAIEGLRERTEYIDIFPFSPITQSCSVSDVLFTGGRGVSDFSVLEYYYLNSVNILNEYLVF